MCDEALRKGLDTEKDKIAASFTTRINALKKKIDRAELDVENKQQQVSRRNTETLVAGGEVILGLLTKRKRSLNTPLSKNRMASKAKDDLELAQQTLKSLQAELKQLEDARDAATTDLQDRLAQSVNEAVEVPLAPTKSNIFVELFGVAWLPYYRVKVGAQEQEVPAV
jgi:chromosome segregation ATPase